VDAFDQLTRGERAEDLARAGADWLAERALRDLEDVSLYQGLAGVVIAMHEAHHHFGDDRFGDAAVSGAEELAARVDYLDNSSLYFGLAGLGIALDALGDATAAARAFDPVRRRFDGQRWNEMYELFMGNAGIGLGALQVGDLDLAVAAVTPYLSTADRTLFGVNWAVRPSTARSHHVAHGTLGIVCALAAVGHAAERDDLLEVALAGGADVVGRNEAGPQGFLVPHSDPPHRPDIIERYSYGWCNGPTGDAQVFRLLGQVTGDDDWTELVDQCWVTVRESGLPRRIRPGFWDNNGRCCGTAGVLALACDRIVEHGDGFDFANVLVDDIAARATVDEEGVRWSNYEHRATPSVLEPRTGWAMGNAGIIRELLRYARLSRGAADSYAVRWPDHPTTSGTVGRDGDKVPRADVEGPSAVAPPSGGNSRPRSHRREADR
jgi:lanthionine synthetase-like protein